MLNKLTFIAASLVAQGALAGTQVWDLDNGSLNGSFNGNTMTVGAIDGNSLQITGWSDTGGTSDDKIRSGELSYDSRWGLMLENRDEDGSVPAHSIDSYGDDFDMVLLSFDTAVDLERFDIGWASEDYHNRDLPQADVTVAAYTGAGDFSFATSDTWSSVVSGGWTSIGHYQVDDYNYQAVTTDVTSKYWLIGAYNPTFTGGEKESSVGSGWQDGFKLASITATSFTPDTTTEVPEPGTLAILASGLFGFMATRRRKNQRL